MMSKMCTDNICIDNRFNEITVHIVIFLVFLFFSVLVIKHIAFKC